MRFKSRIIDDVTKRFLADFSLADAGVAIDARAEIRFRIVQVERQDLIEPNEFFDLTDGVIPAFGGAQIEAGFEKMRGVQANAEAARIFHTLKNFAKVFDAMTKAASLAGGVFEGNANRRHF